MLTISEFILNFVLNAAWQIVIIFAVAALASRVLKNGPARYRHLLWVVTLAVCLVVPLLTATRWVPTWVANFQVVRSEPVNMAQVVTNSSADDAASVDHIG